MQSTKLKSLSWYLTKIALAVCSIAFANTKNLDAGLVERLHEFNGRLVTDFEANQCVGLGENEIGGKELSFGLKQLRINRCCSGMVLVVLVSQGKERTSIQKYFQSY